MKKQGYNARLDESLGARHGKKSQSFNQKQCLKKCTVMHMVLTKVCLTDIHLAGKLTII